MTAPSRATEDREDAALFEWLVHRAPSESELKRFVRSRQRLLLGLPARSRRRAARVITRL